MFRVEILITIVKVKQQIHPVRRLIPGYPEKEIVDRQHLRCHDRDSALLHGLTEVLREKDLAPPVREYEAGP